MATAYRVNLPRVVHETVDGESMIIDGDTGAYYSLRGTAAVVWSLIEEGASRDRMVSALAERFDGEPGTIMAETCRFLQELHDNGLIVESEEEPSAIDTKSGTSEERKIFEAPQLAKFTDMQEILLVDPIHEVTDEGWPHRQDANA